MAKRVILILIVLAAGVAFWQRERIINLFQADTRTQNNKEVKLLFREDPTLNEIIEMLIESEVIDSDKEFREYISRNKVDTNNFAAGKYIVLSKTQMSTLVDGFLKNKDGHGNAEIKVNVVFNRCVTIEDIGANISKCIRADSQEIVDYIKNDATLKKYNFTVEQMPAMFIPKTYKMYFDSDANEFVEFMAQEFKLYWSAERLNKMRDIGLQKPSEVSTLASIVFSEQSQMKEEWPIIAQLYLNRLKKGMKLQSDPTFKYCWPDRLQGIERLLNIHKNRDCPYNTYMYNGLPPGPICIPPEGVLDAVLNPKESHYLFMCGKPGGQGHNFAESNRDHDNNVRIYRAWLKEYLKNK